MKFTKILKFEYLKNNKSFWNEIKNIFPSFKSALTLDFSLNISVIIFNSFIRGAVIIQKPVH